MFDAYLRKRAERTGESVRPLRPGRRLRPVRGRQAALRRRPLLPGRARNRAARGRSGRPAVGRDGPRSREPQERARAGAPEARRRRGLRGLGAVRPCGPRGGAPHCGRVRQRELQGSSRGRRDRGPVRGPHRRDRRRAESTCGESPRPTRSSLRPRSWVSNRRKRPSSRTHWRESRPGARGTSASSSESTAPDSGRPCSSTAPTSSSPTWPSCWSKGDHPPRLRRRSLERPRDATRPERARADGVGVRALERAHRPAGQPRRGGALRDPGHLPELVLRAAASPLRRGRLRLPRVRPDDLERDERQDHPPARRRRAVRRPLRAPARPRARARPPRRRSATARRVGVAGGNGRPCRFDAARLVCPPLRGGDPLRGAAGRFGPARRQSSRS